MADVFLNALFMLPPLVFSVVVHEVAHGWTAEKLGDPTARAQGRITLNPIPHIDPFFTILVPALLILGGSPVIFGGAKPVPVNPMYFRSPRKGMMWVALAGPVSNFILATLFAFILRGFLAEQGAEIASFGFFGQLIVSWIVQGLVINLVLGLFNLLPIPPLDGGRIAVGLLPIDLARRYARIEPYGLLIIFFLLYAKLIDPLILPFLRWWLELLLPSSGSTIPPGFD